MEIVILTSIIVSSVIFLGIGFTTSSKNKSLSDFIPITLGKSHVRNSTEFSASTVATTVSLATIVISYFQLAGYFGMWLLWTVLTTAIGMFWLSKVSPLILKKLAAYDHRPSLHEYLGSEYASGIVKVVGAICSSVGFLLIFATELLVGSRFLAFLVPSIPEWITVLTLSLVSVVYTFLGGYRAVIKTDNIMMNAIWALIIAFFVFIGYGIFTADLGQLSAIPTTALDFSNRDGLIWFLVGIAIMNIPTHISNMSIWQRIGASSDQGVVNNGLKRSTWMIAMAWGFLAVVSVLGMAFVNPEDNTTYLYQFLQVFSSSTFGLILLFIITVGLYAAMLSTASTLLIATVHTFYEDVIANFRSEEVAKKITAKGEFRTARITIIIATIIAVALVEGLKLIGFSISDLVFAIYGGALALFPPILLSLYLPSERLHQYSKRASIGVVLGFIVGWGMAIVGKIIGDDNMIFLSPTFGIAASALMLWLGSFKDKPLGS
ncbi:MAG: hypothetical protein R8G66_16340 [Cytophagales bacterium]|nr:hypothetical protein [Cytophagales bacterium]